MAIAVLWLARATRVWNSADNDIGYDERRTAVKEEALAAMRNGIQEAENEPPGDVDLVFAHAYAEPPTANARDLDDLRRVHGR